MRVTSTAAAQVFNIYPRKGLIAPGSDADIILLDPSVRHTLSAASHHSNMDTNIYEGMAVHGKVGCRVAGWLPHPLQELAGGGGSPGGGDYFDTPHHGLLPCVSTALNVATVYTVSAEAVLPPCSNLQLP